MSAPGLLYEATITAIDISDSGVAVTVGYFPHGDPCTDLSTMISSEVISSSLQVLGDLASIKPMLERARIKRYAADVMIYNQLSLPTDHASQMAAARAIAPGLIGYRVQ